MSVVLPAPLGPMRKRSSPSATVRSTPSRARKPSKTTRTSRSSSMAQPPQDAGDALRGQGHDQDEQRALQVEPAVGELLAEGGLRVAHDDGAEHRPGQHLPAADRDRDDELQ